MLINDELNRIGRDPAEEAEARALTVALEAARISALMAAPTRAPGSTGSGNPQNRRGAIYEGGPGAPNAPPRSESSDANNNARSTEATESGATSSASPSHIDNTTAETSHSTATRAQEGVRGG
jgi:hypothetical protein